MTQWIDDPSVPCAEDAIAVTERWYTIGTLYRKRDVVGRREWNAVYRVLVAAPQETITLLGDVLLHCNMTADSDRR